VKVPPSRPPEALEPPQRDGARGDATPTTPRQFQRGGGCDPADCEGREPTRRLEQSQLDLGLQTLHVGEVRHQAGGRVQRGLRARPIPPDIFSHGLVPHGVERARRVQAHACSP
jgi:hypothetical protein